MAGTAASRISPLKEEDALKVHSSRHISSLQDVVLSLLENSLDAGSRTIEVSVDWPRGGCVVEDDGQGIGTVEFESDGGLVRMHWTSKRHTHGTTEGHGFEMHGTRGTFLAELASLSMLSITSKTSGTDDLAVLTLHHGSVISRQPRHANAGNTLSSYSVKHHGTTVTVRDLFGNMPVRVKQRTLASPDEHRMWQELKSGIVSLLLAWHKPCVVKLRDVNSDFKTVTLASHELRQTTELTTRNLSRLRGHIQPFDIRDKLSLLFQSGFAPPQTRQQWVPLSASTPTVKLKGLVCLEPSPTKQCQFISIGIHPCKPSTGHADFYDAINKVFADSDFGSMESMHPDSAGCRSSRTQDMATELYSVRKINRKGGDRFAMFCIQVTFSSNSECNPSVFESMGHSLTSDITQTLEAAASAFLNTHLFRPTGRKRSRNKRPISAVHSHGSNLAFHPSNELDRSKSADEILCTCNSSDATTCQTNRLHDLPTSRHTSLDSHSHIKVGTSNRNHEVPPDESRVANFPAAISKCTIQTINGQFTRPIATTSVAHQSVIRPASIEAGQYSKEHQARTSYLPWSKHTSGLARALGRAVHETSTAAEQPSMKELSRPGSDDYGSVDQDDMIAAAEEIERGNGSSVRRAQHEPLIRLVEPISNQTNGSRSEDSTLAPQQMQSLTSNILTKRSMLSGPLNALDTTKSFAARPLLSSNTIVSENQGEASGNTGEARWLPNFLKAWDNPIFSQQPEEPIPSLSRDRLFTSTSSAYLNLLADPGQNPNFPTMTAESHSAQFSKDALKAAKVIRQVDDKFILCKMNAANEDLVEKEDGGAREILALVDQHAASERIIVEKLLNNFCNSLQSARTLSQVEPSLSINDDLDCPLTSRIHFKVSAREYDLFALYREHFAAWGIQYDLSSTTALIECSSAVSHQDLKVLVNALPTVIAERCSNFPKLCIDLMRTEIWALADGTKRPVPAGFFDNTTSDVAESAAQDMDDIWLRRISACPQGILDMINSRACRSAIMFNDILTLDQCKTLMKDLGDCTFPFICAHGRASMVPLIGLEKVQAAMPLKRKAEFSYLTNQFD